MHRVLQQKWVNGKACLVEDGELEILLDVLNLSSDDVTQQREAESVSERNQEDYQEAEVLTDDQVVDLSQILAEEQQVDSREGDETVELVDNTMATEEANEDGEVEELEQVTTEEAEELELQHYQDDDGEDDQVVTWYYWPNGSLMKG
ncbi:MAG: hypothetical protein GX262_07030 [Clostridia bacterium]|jgi:hypothetical protein|nr:hypothetical protein [Clostridia bacterium]